MNNICKFSVSHPVGTIVLMALIILFGAISFTKLPVREYPNVDIPVISISTNYTGAASDIIESKITQVIETAISGINGLSSIQSKSKDGKSSIKVEFTPSTDINTAANDIRDKISKCKLPKESERPVIAKYDSNAFPIMILAITSSLKSGLEINDYISKYLIDKFSAIEGVADVSVLGKQEKAMKIWIKKDLMAAKNITVSDIEKAIKKENIEYPGGRIESTGIELPIIIKQKYTNINDFKNLIISNNLHGNVVRLEDIAEIEISEKNTRDRFTFNQKPTVGLAISKHAKSDIIFISKSVNSLISKLESILPDDMRIEILRDDSKFVQESISEVYTTLFIAAILVFLVILCFLGNFKATLIPAITIPISIVGSFSVLYIFGYSINTLTLLSIVLAIGIVVDDSIVVLENIYRRIENGEGALKATINGAQEVILAVMATTAVLISVFLPICMWSGKTGKLFSEFAVAISAAIFFSCVVSITLTPVMCAKMLTADSKIMFNITEYVKQYLLDPLSNIYKNTLNLLINNKKTGVLLFLLINLLCVISWPLLESEYEPLEDRSMLTVKVKASEGTNFSSMCQYMDSVEKALLPYAEKGEIKGILSDLPGFGDADATVNSGQLILELANHKNRAASQTLAKRYRKVLKDIPYVKSNVLLPMGLNAKGTSPIQIIITGQEYQELQNIFSDITNKVEEKDGIIDIESDYKESTPHLIVSINKNKASYLGISAKEIGMTLEAMLASKKVSSYIDGGKEYDVILHTKAKNRKSEDDIKNIYVRSTFNDLIMLDNVVDISKAGCSNKISRFNKSRAITITANTKNCTLSSALNTMNGYIREVIPSSSQVFYKGQSKDLLESTNDLYAIFLLAITISFLILAAQFESFVSPLIVMTAVPLGVVGALLGMHLFRCPINIYNNAGILILIGLSAKQGILIVEFANQLLERGAGIKEAIFQALQLRLRPIFMTGIAAIAGAIPLVCATGAGSAGRFSIGIVQILGGISGTLLTCIFIPLLYLILKPMEKKL